MTAIRDLGMRPFRSIGVFMVLHHEEGGGGIDATSLSCICRERFQASPNPASLICALLGDHV